MMSAAWAGELVLDALGDGPDALSTTSAPAGRHLHELLGMALRRNPRRPHLLVSTVLGKHVPVDPQVVVDAGRALGDLAASALRDLGASERPLVLGYAETATALGHLVADALHDGGHAPTYLHSTRRVTPGLAPAGGFEEAHSHAVEHRLVPDDPAVLHDGEAVVLVDDELSTGRTVAATIRALHAIRPRTAYVVAALVDLRGDDDRALLQSVGTELGAHVAVVALAAGRLALHPDAARRAAALAASLPPGRPLTGPPGDVVEVAVEWPTGLREGGRHGFTAHHRPGLEAAVAAAAGALRPLLAGGPVHVLGTEELMYLPLRIAGCLAEGGVEVVSSTTTRSPVVAADDPRYAIRSAVTFDGRRESPGDEVRRHAYNLRRVEDLVVVADRTARAGGIDGLLDAVRPAAGRVLVVEVPDAHAVPGGSR